MQYPFRILCGLVCTIFLLSGTATAQTQRPDAGLLLQEQRQPAPTLPDRLPDREKPEIVQPQPVDTGVKVLVKSFRFTGSYQEMATEAELQALVKDSLGQMLGFAELQHLAALVTNYLREKKGYLLARAFLPRQDITEGSIEIVIIAGRIDGKVRLNIKPPARIRPTFLEGIARKALPEDGPARLERIERAVLLINDLPGIHAQASLEPGDKPGSTRIIIDAVEKRFVSGLLSGDNYGDRYTGLYRGSGQIALQDLSGFGDSLNLSFTGAENLNQGRASYATPLGTTGLTGNLYYSSLSYQLGQGLSALEAKGWADTLGAGLSYPLLRSRSASLWSGLGFEYLKLEDEAMQLKTRERRLSVGNLNLTGSFYDGFGGGGLTNANITVTGGQVDLSGCRPNEIADAAGPGTQGGFVRGTYSLGRLQRATTWLSLFASFRGQFASGNLDSSQKFILGGPTGVRAYPVGEAPADEGHAFTLETRYDIPSLPAWAAAQLIGFFDTGWVKLQSSPWSGSITNASGRNDYFLSGAGVGINIGKPGHYGLRVSYAHKIGPNPGQSLSGNNADGQNDSGRFWLQLLVWL